MDASDLWHITFCGWDQDNSIKIHFKMDLEKGTQYFHIKHFYKQHI